ncbi:Hsp33 family molecular chaperone HslO [Aestuariirhabdus sp. Z084]|uniref:Hsp33 family molecular chaperone HslO n=1 Tax=Aestuariirhabdus haliotis TaxID=2918751 RepID=UPI00201B41C7|nr:Hsp33 family molecular chaperone HslO [Aestuariirhabdus haliotis]MCL6414386.1 Hsp33 family molecular chaperone HslO [Aestuariirhabdus haliotis]MCL6418318.1 Hsp33 family molecular chaperone HslO [Aestuariirhabdus haliotis]
MSNHDLSQRFIFDDTDIRGELVRLDDSYRSALAAHDYPPAIHQLLGELSACAVLLSATLKFKGTLSLQARSNGPLTLLMVEINHKRQFRALARFDDDKVAQQQSLHELMPDGQLVITIDPEQGKRYQGIVPFDGQTLEACFAHYFAQSEQLPTRLWLQADTNTAFGLLLQALPGDQAKNDEQASEDWNRMVQLADTLSRDEMLELPVDELLHRLYHEETLRLFDPLAVQFHCNCSFERTGRALYGLGKTEVEKLLTEQPVIEIDCQFCSAQYHFSKTQVKELFDSPPDGQLH